jgi:hypothetical protein
MYLVLHQPRIQFSKTLPPKLFYQLSIVSFPYTCNSLATVYRMYIPEMIRYAGACCAYDRTMVKWRHDTDKQVDVKEDFTVTCTFATVTI